MKHLDVILTRLTAAELVAYEELIELWVTYGGD